MISFYDGQLTDLLPRNLTDDPAAQAYSYALREGTRLLYQYTQLCYVYCSIDTLPGKILDLMAAELRTQYYADSMDIETKRGLVRNTLIWYMTAGTPSAVEELIAVVFGTGKVMEWFEYGGKPYWFKASTEAMLTEDMSIYFLDMLRKVKNTRSHLEALEIPRETGQTLYFFTGCCLTYEPPPIVDGYTVEREAGQIFSVGGIANQSTEGPLVVDGFSFTGMISGSVMAGIALQQEQEGVLTDGCALAGKTDAS